MKIGNYDVQQKIVFKNEKKKFRIMDIEPITKYFHFDKTNGKFTVTECIDRENCLNCKLAKILFDKQLNSEAMKHFRKARYYLPILYGNSVCAWEFGKAIHQAYIQLITNNNILAKKKNKKYKDLFFTYIRKGEGIYASYDDSIFHLGKISKTVGELNKEARNEHFQVAFR